MQGGNERGQEKIKLEKKKLREKKDGPTKRNWKDEYDRSVRLCDKEPNGHTACVVFVQSVNSLICSASVMRTSVEQVPMQNLSCPAEGTLGWVFVTE